MEAEHHVGEVTDVPENFKKWVGKNKERIATAKRMPNFLKDNEQYWRGKEKGWKKELEEYISTSRKRYNEYLNNRNYDNNNCYFDEKTGGYYVSHIKHQFSKRGGGGDAEITVSRLLAEHGKHVELRAENKDVPTADLSFDGKTWDVKYIEKANENTIRKYIRDARKANCAIFYSGSVDKMQELHNAVNREIGWFKSRNELHSMPDIYTISGNGELVRIWGNVEK